MNTLKVETKKREGVIAPELHGQFIEFLGSCIYDGIWVGEESKIPQIHGFRRDVLEAMKRLAPPVIRWPGGCFADTYHWRDGIGKRTQRPVRYNENFGTYEVDTNQFGTHEFMEFCELVRAKPWLNVNLMTGTPAEMREWAEYCNRKEPTSLSKERAENGHLEPFDVELWGIGNEAWDGGGKYTAEDYAAEYRKYATALGSAALSTKGEEHTAGAPISPRRPRLIASGADGNKPKERVAWTKDFFREMARYRMPALWGIDLHFYNWNLENREVGNFQESDVKRILTGCLELEEVIAEQAALIEEGCAAIPEAEGFFSGRRPSCELIVGEWGNWHGYAFGARPALYQEGTMMDAITSAMTLDIFHRNCDKVKMACVAQSVNVLNSLFLTKGEQTILTPVYHVFDLYQVHRGAEKVRIDLNGSARGDEAQRLYSFASVKERHLYLNVVHVGIKQTEVLLKSDGKLSFQKVQMLASDDLNDGNTFSEPERLKLVSGIQPTEEEKGWRLVIPACAVVVYDFELL